MFVHYSCHRFKKTDTFPALLLKALGALLCSGACVLCAFNFCWRWFYYADTMGVVTLHWINVTWLDAREWKKGKNMNMEPLKSLKVHWKKNQVKERLNEYMTWASLHPLFLFSWWAMKPMWLVRWILLLPPWARLGRKITRMPDNHSRATAFSSCTPLFSFPPWWRQPPRPHDSAANSTPAGFTVHLAPLHVLLSSPSRNADLFTTWAHSHDSIVAAVCISRLLAGGKRSGGSVARWWQQTPKWQQSRVLLGFCCSHYRLNNSSVCCKMVLLCVYLHVAD